MSRVLVLIPARYQSSRFPGKPLSKINNISMIQRVFENCKASGFESFVVTDDQRIEDHVKEFGGEVLRVDDDVPSGTERIALALERNFKDVDLVINVQGDEPLLTGEWVKKIGEHHLKSEFDIMTMVKRKSEDHADYQNPNVVKAIYCESNSRCLYFSRASAPFNRDKESDYSWFHHIGVYSYKPTALKSFAKAPMGQIEKIEKLEQLRALELGMSIGAMEVPFEPIGVDTPQDIHKIEEVLSE